VKKKILHFGVTRKICSWKAGEITCSYLSVTGTLRVTSAMATHRLSIRLLPLTFRRHICATVLL